MLLQSNHLRLKIVTVFKHLASVKQIIKDETEDAMNMAGEDERREDNTAAGEEEETTFTTNTEVSNNLFHGHHISASVLQISSPGASTSDVIINVDQE